MLILCIPNGPVQVVLVALEIIVIVLSWFNDSLKRESLSPSFARRQVSILFLSERECNRQDYEARRRNTT